jgi:hypothetical protein
LFGSLDKRKVLVEIGDSLADEHGIEFLENNSKFESMRASQSPRAEEIPS